LDKRQFTRTQVQPAGKKVRRPCFEPRARLPGRKVNPGRNARLKGGRP
jgi:hypothetical protein